MTRFPLFRIREVALLFLLLLPPPLLAQTTGRLVGTAVHAETGTALVGAEVRVQGTSLTTLTDSQGRFVLARVPAGLRVVEIGYLGRESQTREVTVQSGTPERIEFRLPVAAIALEGVTAIGSRAMSQARALTEQRNAPNVVNVVAADQMGRFPDASAPEALQRIPGVAVERDQGEGRYVQIRGGSAAFTQVNLDGATVPSPEGDSRVVALDAVPVEILEAMEVTKAITPDMDASAIGGAVNLVTRRAPASPLLSVELGAGYAPIREEPAGEGALTLGRRFAGGRLGLLLNGSYSNRDFGSDDVEPEYDLGEPGLADDVLSEFQSRYYSLTRKRLGAAASLDYRLSPTSEIVLTGAWTEHEDTEQRRILNHVIEDAELSFEHKNRRETLEIASANLGGEHLLRGALQLDWSLGLSRAAEDTPYDVEAFFLQEDVSFSPDLSDPDRIRPNPTTAALAGRFPFSELESESSLTTNIDRIARVDLGVPYRLGGTVVGTLKLGGKITHQTKDREVAAEVFEPNGGPDIVLGADVGTPFPVSGYNPGSFYAFPPTTTSPADVRNLAMRFGERLESQVDLEAETEDYELSERVDAAYLMTELNLTPRLLLLPGLRYEHTSFSADGFDFDPDTETLSPRRAERDYGNFFPMAHLRYRLGEQTNVRAAFTTAMARPAFFDLVPYRIRDDEDLEIGNPELDPTTARSWDLLVEHYAERIGVLSAGVFLKRLEDPIFAFVSENNLGGETVQPGNGASAEIRGAEFALQQQLHFLPGALAGLGVFANYTWTDSEGTLADGRSAKLAGQADHIANAALGYERRGFSGQLSLNYHDAYVSEYGEAAAEDIFVGSRHQLDLSASYRVGSRGTLYLELLNLTNQPFVLYQGTEERPRQREYYEPWGVLGFRVNR